MLLSGTLVFTLAAVALAALPLVLAAVPALPLAILGGACLLAAAGFGAALLLAQAQADETRPPSWVQPGLAIGGGLLTGTIVFGAWRLPVGPTVGPTVAPTPDALLATGGCLLLLAFPVLVFERFWAGLAQSQPAADRAPEVASSQAARDWAAPDAAASDWSWPDDRSGRDRDAPDRPAARGEAPNRLTPDTDAPDRPGPRGEAPDRLAPDWLAPGREAAGWEPPDWVVPDGPAPGAPASGRTGPNWETRGGTAPDRGALNRSPSSRVAPAQTQAMSAAMSTAGPEPGGQLPEAAGLAALLRAVLLLQLVLGLALLLQGSGMTATTILVPATAAVTLLLAAEFVLRGVAALFLPAPAAAVARPAARSLLATFIQWRLPRPALVHQAVTRHWGIDLSRSWALGFVGRALLPVGLLLAFLAWGLTGLVALPLDQRAVYEEVGRPVAVLQPGLHLLLPWPLGITRRVERGVLHELTLGGAAPSGERVGALPAAEDAPPQSADRLWDRPHPGETTYLIASPAAAGQGFQRVDVDLRLMIRVGLSDQAALQAAYAIAEPDEVVRASAGRLLSRYFAVRTLTGVLGEDRQTFTDAIRTALQQDLDQLGTGLEVVAVVVEAIHPPPAAADAWHAVESAAIRARVAVADEAGAAAKTEAAARTSAEAATFAATATAAEIAAKASADRTLFAADHTAYAAEPDAFRLERWLARLRTTLPRAQLLVLDHRIAGAAAPTVDLRDLAPAMPTPP